ncbi:MAG: right-handed parallel beta-helix repeat-containing protein [Bacteroidaceae bacterium]|nr:right-handed parallel beta-helix repeat-containing protein [Bacteroidaceae bacterium]
METTERLKLDVNGTYSVSKALESGPQRIATFDLMLGETIEINVVTTISTYSKSIYLYSAAGAQIGYASIAKTSTSGCITYTAANRMDGAYFVINSLEGLTYDISITKSRHLMSRIEDVEMADSLEEWARQFPDGFGRSSEEAPAVAVDLPIPLSTSRLYIKVRKLSEYVRINYRLSCNINTSSNMITLRAQQFNNGAWAPDGTQTLVLDVAALLANSVPTGSEVTNLYFRFMQNSSTFYGMFTLEEWRYVTLDSLYHGKVDKEIGKGLSSEDFTTLHRQKLDGLSNYDDTALSNRVAALEENGVAATAIQAAVANYLSSHTDSVVNVTDGSLSWNKFSEDCQKQIRNNVINVQDRGAMGDGTSDNYEILKGIFNNLNEGDVVYFPHGEYIIDFQGNIGITQTPQQASDYGTNGITPKRCKSCMAIRVPNVMVIGDGSTIRVAQTMFWEYQVFTITPNGTNFLIKDLNLVGDYREHVDTEFYYNSTQYYSHEFGYGIFIQGNGRVEDCRISYMTGDAIVTKNSSPYGNSTEHSGSGGDIIIDHCELFRCRRQGISVLDSDDIWVRNSYIHEIGDVPSLNLQGKFPKGGVDMEPGSGSHHIRSFHLHNSIVRNNFVSLINGQNNVGIIDILNSECGLTNVNSPVFARNSMFFIDSEGKYIEPSGHERRTIFYITGESTMIGCHFVCALKDGESNNLKIPRLSHTDIINDVTNATLTVEFEKELVDCYFRGITIYRTCKGQAIGTTFDSCGFEHASSARIIIFNGCIIQKMVPLSYPSHDANGNPITLSFMSDGLIYNKCLLIDCLTSLYQIQNCTDCTFVPASS